ncbi:MAG: hypothetical protein K0R25_502 [Rickettsiaceae bacterium]|jgi:DNA recombination protein RmuC|nr:hypothetical protein [Rickettsiaceae bacterium]
MINLLGILAGGLIGSVLTYFIFKAKTISKTEYDELKEEFNEAAKQIAASEEKNSLLNKFYEELKKTNLQQQNEINFLNKEVAKASAINSSLKEEILAIQQASRLEFSNIANKILDEKSEKFTQTNKANIDGILKPLGESIEAFKKKVEDTYDRESKQRFSLDEKIKELIQQTNKVSSEANNLASALKGQTKRQGNWGEMILESILQQSGLIKGTHYFKEQNIKNDDGNNLRPDFQIYLPHDDKGNKRVIMTDSKVSLIAYDQFCSSETPELQASCLKEHLKSIYRHIDNLAEKKYDDFETAVDFTIMFIPIEPAYLNAIQHDAELWSYAYSKRILLISPTNLIVCLKLIADLWKRDMQSKNAMEIVNRGEKLYEKFVGFSDSMLKIGKHIEGTQAAYSDALDKLKTGRGNLVDQALKLKNLGLKSSKQIPLGVIPNEVEIETVEIEIGSGKISDQEN